jgi:3-phosphoshikimate 1-carboxyvinyltransferase
VRFVGAGAGALQIEGVGLLGLQAPRAPIDCGNSGTSMRLLCGLLAGQRFSSVLDGDRYLRARPMARVVRPLVTMGARIEGEPGAKAGDLYPPLRIEGGARLVGVEHEGQVASAQVKSALLLAGLYAEGPVRVREPSLSRDHTERMLRALGAPLEVISPSEVVLDPRGFSRQLPARDWIVPGDLSSAAFLLVAALLIPGSEVTVTGACVNPTRTGILDALRAMGASIGVESLRDEGGEPVADVTARYGPLQGTTLEGELVVRAIDEVPILAIAAARAHGRTVIRDAEELRVKESDRLAATARELLRFGISVKENPDGLEIEGGGPLKGGVACESSGDHRIAMSCAVMALCAPSPVEVSDVANVATSFPGFIGSLQSLGVAIEIV